MAKGDFYEVAKQYASEYPVVEGTRCVSVHIPDDDSYLPVLAAALAALGNTWSSRGTVEQRRDWSQMWQRAYAATDWEGCMNCEQVADCIETNENVQTAINNVYNQYGTGVPMPSNVRNRNMGGTIIDCNPDQLWGAINELIDSMNTNNIDAQEVVEVASNIAERASLLFAAIPVVETLPINEAIDYVEQVWTDTLFEIYIGNDTEGYRDELKCDLFCLARDNNCVLTIDMLYNYFSERVGYIDLGDFAALIAYLTSGVWAGTQVNDIFYLIQIGAMVWGNQFFQITGLRPYEMYMALGANNPDADWEILCTECSNDCVVTYDYSNQPLDISMTYGTLNPANFVASGVLDSTAWAIWENEQPFTNLKAIRVYVDKSDVFGWEFYTTTALYTLAEFPVKSGEDEWYWYFPVDGLPDGDWTAFNIRKVLGDLDPFNVLRIRLTYEC